MATRFYFNAGRIPFVAPSSWSAGWNKTSGVGSNGVLVRSKWGVGASQSNAASGTSGHFTALRRFVSFPLSAQTISGNIKGQIRCLETAAGDNYTIAIAIKVIQPNGTDRGVLLAATASDDTAATPPEMATTGTNRSFRNPAESASIALSSVSASAGDLLVVEIGFRQASASVNNGSFFIRGEFGVSDLSEDDTTTTDLNSWIEFDTEVLAPIEYFDSASTPADGAAATGTADPTAVTPPTGMIAGDLVCMIGQQRATGATLAISADGGQTWTTETAAGTTNQTARLFWCIFNGTWSANPSVDFSATTCNSVQMHVFRPPSADFTWIVHAPIINSTDATDPFAIASRNTVGLDPVVNLAGWFSADDNTYGSLSGTGWANIGSDQYRNTSGSDQSASYACNIQTTPGATNSVQKSQLTLGADTAATFIASFNCVDTTKIYQTGATLQFNATNAVSGTVSTAITVPAGTDFIAVGVSGAGGAMDNGGLTFTKGGADTSMTKAVVSSSANFRGGLWYMVAPDTGASKSLKWNWVSGGLDAAAIFSISFWKNVDQTTPVRDSDSGTGGAPPFTTPTMTAQSGDRIAAFAGWFAGVESASATWSNLSRMFELTWNTVAADGAWAIGDPTGNVAVELTTGTSVEDGGIAAMVMQKVSSGATTQKAINVSLGETVSVAGRPGKTIKPTMAELVSLMRQTGHRVPISQSQSVSVFKAMGRQPFIVTIGQAITLSQLKAQNKLFQISQGQSILTFRAVSKLVAVTQAQAVSLTRYASHLVTVTTAQAVSALKSVGRRVLVTMGQAVTVTANFVAGAGQTFQQAINVAQAQSVLLFRSTGKLVLVGVGESVTLRRSSGHAAIIGQPQSVSLVKQIGRRVLVTMAQAVTTFQRSRREKALNVTQAQAVTLRRSLGEFVSVLQAQAVTVRASIAKIIRVTQAQSIVISNGTQQTFQKALTVTQAQIVTLRRSVGKLIAIMTAQVVALLRRLATIIRVSTAQAVTVVRSVGHRVVVAMGQTVTRTVVRAKLKIVNVSQSQAATLRWSMGKVITIQFAQSLTVLRRQAVIIRVSTEQSIAVVKAVSKRVAVVTQAQIVSVATSVGAQLRTVVVVLSTGQTISVIKSIGKIVSVQLAMLVSVFTAFAGRIRRASMSRGTVTDHRFNVLSDVRNNVGAGSRSNQSQVNRSNGASGTRKNSAD